MKATTTTVAALNYNKQQTTKVRKRNNETNQRIQVS